MSFFLFIGALLLLGSWVQTAFGFIECSVLDYGAFSNYRGLDTIPNIFFIGAVADNTTDLGPALTKAWQECVIPQVTTTVATDVLLRVYVPAGDYLLALAIAVLSSMKQSTINIFRSFSVLSDQL